MTQRHGELSVCLCLSVLVLGLLPLPLSTFTNGIDTEALLGLLSADPLMARHTKLNQALIDVVDSYNLVCEEA